MPSNFTHIGEAIRARREKLGLTQRELCARLEWKPGRVSEISDIESGKTANITLARLDAFAHALDCHSGDLVFMVNTQIKRTA